MTEILSHGYRDKNRDANQGVVMEELVKSIQPENSLIALLYQLLGTVNDIRYYPLANVVDTLFEDWQQDLPYIHDDVENVETVIAELERRKNQLNDHLDRTVEKLNLQKQRLCQNTQIKIGNRTI